MVRVVFIGGLDIGKVVYDYLRKNKNVDLALAITYPECEDKHTYSNFSNDENVVRDISANKYIEKIQALEPDFIFVSGWSEMLHKELVHIPKRGTVGFHPSKLPADRGRSVLAWQIEEGYESTALSMFYLNDLADCGDIIAQEKITIDFEDSVNEVLQKVGSAANNLMKAYFPLIREGKAPRIPQKIQEGNFRRLRNDKDSEINWNTNSIFIYNKVRAISHPYPGAIAVIDKNTYRIWKCEILDFQFGKHLNPGSIVATLHDNTLIIKTRNGFLRVISYSKI